MTIKDLQEFEGMFFVGDLIDIDGSPWVDEASAKRILEILQKEI